VLHYSIQFEFSLLKGMSGEQDRYHSIESEILHLMQMLRLTGHAWRISKKYFFSLVLVNNGGGTSL
jgi:hypothetical protein